MKILDYLKNNYLIFDGAMGSLLQQGGLKAGELAETLNITNAQLIQDIHYNYYISGSNIVLTNTFGANRLKYYDQPYRLEEIIKAAINNALEAKNRLDKQAFVAYDIGPLGQLLKPSGTLTFDEAYDAFKEIVIEANKYDIDAFVVETISDLMEAKAAVLAIKENSDKPVFVTLTFEENSRTLVGNDIKSIVATLEGLKVDALGLNCGFGPKQMLPLVKEFVKYSSTLVMVQPNAGIPIIKDGKLSYDIDENMFLEYMKEIIDLKINLVGGCCGTNYEHIIKLSSYLKNHPYELPKEKNLLIVSSGMQAVLFDRKEIIKIGERINPTGKPLLKEALLNDDFNYLVKEALAQESEDVHILDVNVGLPKIDEVRILKESIEYLQSYTKLPLQIDSSNPKAIENALRYYNGKAIVNSVNGKQENMDAILPSIAKYGGALIALCIDENGLALSVEDKIRVVNKIVKEANKYGIKNKDIIVDPLTLTVSAQQEDVIATLDAIKFIKNDLNLKTSLGVSNISFGLPNRELMNATFTSMAIYAGLDACIINPSSQVINNAIISSEALLNMDQDLKKYIASQNTNTLSTSNNDKNEVISLQDAIIKGLEEDARKAVIIELEKRDPIDIIENDIIKALDFVGDKFERKEFFLPQLIQSAQSVSSAFEIIKKQYQETNQEKIENKTILLATVKGDVHDIGKNIVKVLLENYGFDVVDLGKDVSDEKILSTIKDRNIKLVGLSALMTTTVENMEIIIKKINDNYPDVKIMVGGAVLTKEYASKINADYYCKDALQGVAIAKKTFN